MYKKLCVKLNTSIKEAIKSIDIGGHKIVLVIDNSEKLLGVITDSDIRRYILKNGDLNADIEEVMQKNPKYVYDNERKKIKMLMLELGIDAVPVVNKEQQVIDIVFLKDILKKEEQSYILDVINLPVVIMAGGKGTRLQPYTNIIPKPLIPIADVTIVERIINNFKEYGCKNFYMTINYKKNMIKSYFEDINMDYNLQYIEEDTFLGTGGSLYLLKDEIKSTFFVSNCDILIDANYSDILKHHRENKNLITVITSLKNFTIPYGIINISKNGAICDMKEKPEYNFLVNTGMYILEPEVLEDIPENTFFHITDLINKYIVDDKKVGVYPITENAWLDMGEVKEMERMIERLGM